MFIGKLLKGCLESTVHCDIKCESPITVLKILYTLVGGPLNAEVLGFRLSSLWVNTALGLEHG